MSEWKKFFKIICEMENALTYIVGSASNKDLACEGEEIQSARDVLAKIGDMEYVFHKMLNTLFFKNDHTAVVRDHVIMKLCSPDGISESEFRSLRCKYPFFVDLYKKVNATDGRFYLPTIDEDKV